MIHNLVVHVKTDYKNYQVSFFKGDLPNPANLLIRW